MPLFFLLLASSADFTSGLAVRGLGIFGDPSYRSGFMTLRHFAGPTDQSVGTGLRNAENLRRTLRGWQRGRDFLRSHGANMTEVGFGDKSGRNCGEVDGTIQFICSCDRFDVFLEGLSRFTIPQDMQAMVDYSAGFGITYPTLLLSSVIKHSNTWVERILLR